MAAPLIYFIRAAEDMQLQLNEKDLQALITADEIHKQIFMERDQTKMKL